MVAPSGVVVAGVDMMFAGDDGGSRLYDECERRKGWNRKTGMERVCSGLVRHFIG